MSWYQAAGIRAFCAVGASASAARCASRTGFSGAILRGSVSSTSLGLARIATISRCSGKPFGIRVPRTNWIDFKYQRGRNPWGLNKRLVLEKAQLARLLRAYQRATGLVIVADLTTRS